MRYHLLGDVAISCGSDAKSIAADGRQWIGDESSAHLHLDQPKAKSRSSVAVDIAVSADPGPYRTARISAYEFRYTFQVKPGHKIIRLHFHPILYTSFEKSRDFFTVKSGPFTLVENFSASITAEALGLKYIVKEFCLKVEKNGQLSLIFYPVQHSSKSKKNTHAFVNGIEIISISAGLYFTAEGGVEALAVGRNYAAHVDDHTALETVQRLNTGGSTISPMEDFGLFRRWDADTDYLFNSFVYPSDDQTYTNIPASLPRYIAPMRLYQTSWKSGSQRSAIEDMHNYTWRIPVDPGFAYCVRLHLGGLGTQMPEGSLIQFNILINNQIAETEANIMIWDGGYGTPVFRDYMEVMKGKKEGGKRDLFISLQSTDVKVVSLLNGIEVFKLSDLENSLASPNPVNRKRTSVFWMTKIQHLLLAFSRSHGNMAGMIILITFINTVVYSMRRLWEEDFQWEKDTGSGSTEPYLHCFSIA